MAIMPNVIKEDVIEKAYPYPSEVTPRLYGDQHQPALFSFYADDIISMTTMGGSALQQWLPSRGVDNWTEPIAHLSWVAPEDFTGELSYADYLISKGEVDECDFGHGFDYQVCEYWHSMDRVSMSTKNEPIKRENNVKLFKKQPRLVVRGATEGITLNNDRDWSLAKLGIGFEDHMDWNVINGDSAAIPNSYDGLNVILTNGWVKTHARGKGSCDFTDPLVVPGTNLQSNEEILQTIRGIVRKLRRRIQDRGGRIAPGDMVILMNSTTADYILDTLAFGVMAAFNKPNVIDQIFATTDGLSANRERLARAGFGYGAIPVDDMMIPIIPETRMGGNVTVDGYAGVTSDIYILTKRFRGITILEHQYLAWDMLPPDEFAMLQTIGSGAYQPTFFQNGMIRSVPLMVDGNPYCWYYGADMQGRIVTYMSALQARINDVTVLTDMASEHESASFTSRNFYAFEGAEGGAGNVLLEPLT